MTPERWRQITGIFHAASEREPAHREAFVADACRGDPTLRREVEAMLAGFDDAGALEEIPLFASASASEPGAALDVVALAPGSQLGPYQIVGLLGAGGMGQVYKAFDSRLHREIAVKIAAVRFSERFDREARVIATLNHPNICTIHDVGPNYLVTELVEGETLRDWFRRALPVERSLDIARQVLEALRAAHQADIVHRDLKPENVMVRSDGYVKVLDFGLAARMPSSRLFNAASGATTDMTLVARDAEDVGNRRLSLPGQIVGTIPYMSPEQIQGREVDQRSDLFAFGIMLHEMLTGRHPWPRPSPVDLLHAILHDDPPAMQATSLMRAELAAIVQKLLRKSPAERYQTAEAVLEALGSRAPARGSSPAGVTGPTPLTSIAVLPFLFLSEVEEGHGLSLGFADALITMLGSLDDITVLPTSAILNYAAGTDPAAACRDLGTRHLLQGNVQKVGTHWRVSMHLFDAMMQRRIASEQHDFVLDNVFDVQDEIGRQVVESLRKRFPPAVAKSRDRYSSDPEAYSEFMAGLRESYSDRARIAHEQAQRSNPKTRSGNLEFFYLYSGDFVRAEEAGEAWLRERPGSTYARFFHAQPPLLSGDLDRAGTRLAMALQELPDEPLIASLQGILHARRDQADLALECVRRALDLPRSFGHTHHTYYQIACVYAVLGETDKAMAWLERSVDTGFACWPFFQIDPHLEPLHGRVEFKRLVADLDDKYTALSS